MKFARWHTQAGVDPISRMRLRTYQVDGQSLIVPDGWSEEALSLLLPHMGAEGFASHIYERLRPIRQWAEQEGFFASGEDAAAFKDECAYLLASRRLASTILLDPVETPERSGEATEPANRHQTLYRQLLALNEIERHPFLVRLRERAAMDGIELMDEPTSASQEVVSPESWQPEFAGCVIRLAEADSAPPMHRFALSLPGFASVESDRFDVPGFRRAVRCAAALSYFHAGSEGRKPGNLGLRPSGLAEMLAILGAEYDSPQGQAICFCIGALMAAETAAFLSEAASISEGGSADRQAALQAQLGGALELARSLPILRLGPPPDFDHSQWLENTRAALAQGLHQVNERAPADAHVFWLGFEDDLQPILGTASPALMPLGRVHPNAQVQMAESFESGAGPGQMHTFTDGGSEANQSALRLARELGLSLLKFTGERGAPSWQEFTICGIELETLGSPPFAIRLKGERDLPLQGFVQTLSLYLESGLPLSHLRAALEPGCTEAAIVEFLIS